MLFQPRDKPVLDLFKLTGKTALVTGGSRGIGLGAALALAEAGANVAITYNSTSKEEIADLEEEFKELGVQFKAYKADVQVKTQIFAAVKQALEDFGNLHVVVANAGIAVHEPAESFSEENYKKTMSVNLDGAFYTAQAAAQAFKAQKQKQDFEQGRLIFTALISSQIVNYPQKQAPYNASKAAVVRLAKCLSVEWVDFARVNCVSPGYIATGMLDAHPKEWSDAWFQMIPAQRLCAPYELKGVYVFLASDASSYLTGEEIVVGGGYTLT